MNNATPIIRTLSRKQHQVFFIHIQLSTMIKNAPNEPLKN